MNATAVTSGPMVRRFGGLPYLLPAYLFFAAFGLWPLIETIWISLQEWNGLTPPTFVGLANYREAVGDDEIRGALLHSLILIFFYTVIPIVIGLVIAGVVARVRIRGLAWFRTILFIPQVLPMVVVAVAWRWIYATDGPLNQAFDLVGLTGVSRAWLGDFDFALPAVGLVGSWVMLGLVIVLFVAGVQHIGPELYEAARIDGASAFQEFRAVTVPGLRGEITIAAVVTLTAALRNFDLVWVTTGGGPGSETTVPAVYVYRAVFQTRDIGLGAAIGLLLMVLIALANFSIIRLRGPEES